MIADSENDRTSNGRIECLQEDKRSQQQRNNDRCLFSKYLRQGIRCLHGLPSETIESPDTPLLRVEMMIGSDGLILPTMIMNPCASKLSIRQVAELDAELAGMWLSDEETEQNTNASTTSASKTGANMVKR